MSTTRRKQPTAAPPQGAPEEPARFPHHTWAAGDGTRQVPLAGLLAADPALRDAELSDEEWTARLNEYLHSERV